jgi:hypothetical protein
MAQTGMYVILPKTGNSEVLYQDTIDGGGGGGGQMIQPPPQTWRLEKIKEKNK